MDINSIRDGEVGTADQCPISDGDKRGCVSAMDPSTWLAALPLSAAILSVDKGRITVVKANERFEAALIKRFGRAALTLAESSIWPSELHDFVRSDRQSDIFEIRRDGALGPEYFLCKIVSHLMV